MMEGGELSAPDTAISVGTLFMSGIVQAFAHRTPLHGEVIVVIERGHLINRPRERTVVEHHARIVACRRGISTVVDILLLSTANADEAHDNIVASGVDGKVAQGDARSRSRLAKNCRVGPDTDIPCQGNDTCDIEDDNLLVGTTHGLTKRACARVVKIGDVDNLATASTCGVAAMTFGTREGRGLGLSSQCQDCEGEG